MPINAERLLVDRLVAAPVVLPSLARLSGPHLSLRPRDSSTALLYFARVIRPLLVAISLEVRQFLSNSTCSSPVQPGSLLYQLNDFGTQLCVCHQERGRRKYGRARGLTGLCKATPNQIRLQPGRVFEIETKGAFCFGPRKVIGNEISQACADLQPLDG